ncbi:MAG: hypothetical protein C0467_15725 [Planctomycetaceae bacterium]|nr:hypothetical protein [Planctomycetaceae bacterium]
MSTEELLHQAIADQPEEDTPRLAFADWLDELGGEANSTRAEFIRLQVMLYRANVEMPETKAARQRAADLLERYRTAWGFPTGQLQSRCVIRRGFVDELIVSDRWAARTLAFLPRHPITHIRLEGFSPDTFEVFEIFGLLEVPAFRKVRSLEVKTEQWIDELIGRLIRLGHFPYLESLSLISTGITPNAVVDIARCPRLARLRTLRVSFVGGYWMDPQHHMLRGVRDEGAVALATSPHLLELRELSLRGAAIGPVGARALVESPNLMNLERLILTGNPYLDKDAQHALRQRFGNRVFL